MIRLAGVAGVEQPLTSKGFRFLSIGLTITLLLTILTLAYSAYENFAYISKYLYLDESPAQLSINGTHLTFSNLTLANRGVYPWSIVLAGEVLLQEVKLGSASTSEIIISPNELKRIDLTLPLDFTQVYRDYNLLKMILFNNTFASLKFVANVKLQPFIAASLKGTRVIKIGAVLDGLTFRLRNIKPLNETHVKAEIEMDFTNTSPIAINGLLYASLPSAKERNLRYAASRLEVFAQPSQHYVGHFIFTLPQDELRIGAWYGLELKFDIFDNIYEWRAAFKV